MKVIIAGGRDFCDYALLCRKCDRILGHFKHITVFCGEARGADKMGKRWAKSRRHEWRSFHADWSIYGLAAGPMRNQEMLNAGATHLIAFWNGRSRGTRDMIKRAQLTIGNANVRVVKVKY